MKDNTKVKKPPIVVLLGKTASGKSTILKKLVEEHGYHNVVSHATRPKREGEIEGVDYFYLNSNEEFDRMYESGELIEKTEYLVNGETWKYGVSRSSFSDEKVSAIIVNPIGLEQLVQTDFADRLIFFEVIADTETLIERYWERSDKTDKAKVQLVDRLFKDMEDFGDSLTEMCERNNLALLFLFNSNDKDIDRNIRLILSEVHKW